MHAAWDVGGGGACFEKTSPNGSRFISHPGENVKNRLTPPRKQLFARDGTVRPLTSLGVAGARRRRQATVPAARRCDEHAPRDLARRPAGCSQKAPRLGSERKSAGSGIKNCMNPPWPSRLVWRFATTAAALSGAPRQHKSVITTAGDHDISYRNQNENTPCGLCELDKTQSRMTKRQLKCDLGDLGDVLAPARRLSWNFDLTARLKPRHSSYLCRYQEPCES